MTTPNPEEQEPNVDFEAGWDTAPPPEPTEVKPGCVNEFMCNCEENCPGHCVFCGDPGDYCNGHTQEDKRKHYSVCWVCATDAGYEGPFHFDIHFVPNKFVDGDRFIATVTTCLILVQNLEPYEKTFERRWVNCKGCNKVLKDGEEPANTVQM